MRSSRIFLNTASGGTTVNVTAITEEETLGTVSADPGTLSVNITAITEEEILGTVSVSSGTSVDITAITEEEVLGTVSPEPGALSVAITAITEEEVLGNVSLGGFATSLTVSGITGGANLSSLSYAVFDGADIGTASIIDQGNTETTDANGDLVIDLTGLGVTIGTTLTVIITNYTTTPTASDRGAVCYADAA